MRPSSVSPNRMIRQHVWVIESHGETGFATQALNGTLNRPSA